MARPAKKYRATQVGDHITIGAELMDEDEVLTALRAEAAKSAKNAKQPSKTELSSFEQEVLSRLDEIKALLAPPASAPRRMMNWHDVFGDVLEQPASPEPQDRGDHPKIDRDGMNSDGATRPE